jgi:hypothetical protein
MREAMVYFVTPSELKAKEGGSQNRFLRMGGMVVQGSLQKDPNNLTSILCNREAVPFLLPQTVSTEGPLEELRHSDIDVVFGPVFI